MGATEEFIFLNGDADAVPESFLETWLSGWPCRTSILARIRHLLESNVNGDPVPGFDQAARPATALLHLGLGGIELERNNSFPQPILQEMRSRVPDWSRLHLNSGLVDLYTVLARGRLMKRQGRAAVTCREAMPLMEQDPEALINMLACWTVANEGFNSDVAELGAALLLVGSVLDPVELAERSHPALAEYWTTRGETVALDHVTQAMIRWISVASATGVIPDSWAEGLRQEGTGWPRPVGEVARTALTTMLRYRTARHIPRRFVARMA